jgi:hypothetical protein
MFTHPEIFSWLRIGSSNWLFYEHGNEPRGSIKDREFLDQLSESQEGLCSMELGS